jgi:hypothetical protein
LAPTAVKVKHLMLLPKRKAVAHLWLEWWIKTAIPFTLRNLVGVNTCMRYFEFASIKPPTPQQARVRSLQQRVSSAQTALAAERKAQKLARAQAILKKLRSPQVLLK